MATVGVIYTKKFRGRVKVCPDMAQGIARIGDKVVPMRAENYTKPFSDSIVFYGFDGSRDSNIARAARDYDAAGKPYVYIDLAYWCRKWRGDRYGFHRFSVSARHPEAYFQKVKHPRDRADVVGVSLSKWRKPGKNILLCGMSDKCARFEGFEFEQWEREAIRTLQAASDRPIVYRPKPQRARNGPQYPAIPGVSYSNPLVTTIEREIEAAWAVVSHHSNAGIDAICHGIPCFSHQGVTTAIGHTDLSLIEQPLIPTGEQRRQFVNDIAYCQFNREEMRDGLAWRHLKNEGLVP